MRLQPGDFKATAKEILREKYWWCLLACLVFSFIGSGIEVRLPWEEEVSFTVGVIAFSAVPISLATRVFLVNPIEVGLCRYFYYGTVQKRSFADLFFVFGPHYLSVVWAMFLRDLKLVLWTLCLIVPGIVKSYEYFAIPYLLAENPAFSADQVFSISREAMAGNKGRLFELYLTFFGWYLLAVLTAGIGFFFLAPYIKMTVTIFYVDVRPSYLPPTYEETEEEPSN